MLTYKPPIIVEKQRNKIYKSSVKGQGTLVKTTGCYREILSNFA